MIISWDEYFMGLAHLSALRSKDPNTQVGACIVDEDKKVVSIGYNVVYAELNAILNSTRSLKNTILYVSLFPCNECAKAIIQAGIRKIYYESDKYDGADNNVVSKKMLDMAGVEYEQLPFEVEIDFKTKY